MAGFALITGASKGIGFCFAHQLAAKGYHLLLIARSEPLLNTLAGELRQRFGVEVRFLVLDLSLQESAQKIAQYCQTENLPVEILINNAGYGVFGEFETSMLDDQQNMLQLNIISLVSLTHLMLPVLHRAKKAYILQVASTAAYQAVPLLGTYSASKAFVLSFSRALAYELKNSSVSATCLCPGSTQTNFMNRAGMTNPKIIAAADKLGMSADQVASEGLEAMFKGRPEFIPGWVNWVSSALVKFIPKPIVEKIAANLYKD